MILGEAARLADIEKALDLFVHRADRLHLALLADRAGERERLLDRHPADRRKKRAHLGNRCAVAIDARIGLLEGERGGERERRVLQIPPAQIAGENEHALGVARPAFADLALNVDDLAACLRHGVHPCALAR